MSASRELLAGWGAEEALVEELLPWLEARPSVPTLLRSLPWHDEPDARCWRRRLEREPERSPLERLEACFAELWFPVAAGISRSESYRRALRDGRRPPAASGLALERPERLQLDLLPSLAGSLLTVVTDHRGDFEQLVCALTARSEPIAVPPATGAVLVPAVTDWRRFESERERWTRVREERGLGDSPDFFLRHRESFVDRVALLCASADAAPTTLEVLRQQLVARYLLLRRFRRAQRRILDELLVDFHALRSARGSYSRVEARALLGAGGERLRLPAPVEPWLERAVEETIERLERLEGRLAGRSVGVERGASLAHALLALAEGSWGELLTGDPEARVLGRLEAVAALQRELEPGEARFRAPVRPEALSVLSERLVEGVRARLPERTLGQLQLALDEILSNVVKYGHDPGSLGQVSISARLAERSLRLVVEDDGRPFDPTSQGPVRTDQRLEERPIGGLGLHLVKTFAERLDYRRSGDRNLLELDLGWEPGESASEGRG